MDEFINSLDTALFESTNGLWNELMLNDPWSVGYVTNLIETKPFNNKEEWEACYYESGAERNSMINKLPDELQKSINNEQLVVNNKKEIYNMSRDLKNLNYNFGRTRQQIATKGEILYNHIQHNENSISPEECIEAVRYRTICQTWNGVILREKNTIRVLKNKFPELIFISTDGDFDHRFAVDYEIKNGETLVCGIQIKPKSYLGNALYVKKAQHANARKNQEYKNNFGKPVFNVIAKTNGEIINVEVIKQILRMI